MLTVLMLALLSGPAHAAPVPSAPTLAAAFTLDGAPNQPRSHRMRRLTTRSSAPSRLQQSTETEAPSPTAPELSTQGKVGKVLQIVGASAAGGYVGLITTGFLVNSVQGNDEEAAIILVVGLIGAFFVLPVTIAVFVAGTVVRNQARKKSLSLLPAPVPGGSGLALNVTF